MNVGKDLKIKGPENNVFFGQVQVTKNPDYYDLLYVDTLIGPDTVNTMPPETINAFIDHGNVKSTLGEGIDEAKTQLKKLKELGIDINKITDKLLADGVKSFSDSFESLINSLKDKVKKGKSRGRNMNFEPGNYSDLLQKVIADLNGNKIIERIWQKDHTVWKKDPTEISNRLGWLDCLDVTKKSFTEINTFVNEIRKEGIKQALLMGMGGSSLAPEVFRLTFGVREGFLDLHVLDSTRPEAIINYEKKLDPDKTLYIVSTKSGGTVETMSFMKYFYYQRFKETWKRKSIKTFHCNY